MDTLIPEADVVVTEALEQIASALRHVVAAGGVTSIDGAPGAGKTVALQYALSLLPPGPAVRRVVGGQDCLGLGGGEHVARADELCAWGNFRAFAQITAHVIDAVLTDPPAHSGSALIEAACRWLGGI
ncbi:hypothetical protein ACWGAN_06745 [Streptomyces sp. NPDC054945]